jgi:dihydroxyacid dehydratase/phosphogluconate dehydratase
MRAMIAMARMNIPAIFVYGGTTGPGTFTAATSRS